MPTNLGYLKNRREKHVEYVFHVVLATTLADGARAQRAWRLLAHEGFDPTLHASVPDQTIVIKIPRHKSRRLAVTLLRDALNSRDET